MNKYWLYLEPYTIIFSQEEEFLAYNSISFKSRVFKNISRLREIISQLILIENMYCIDLSEDDIQLEEVKEF